MARLYVRPAPADGTADTETSCITDQVSLDMFVETSLASGEGAPPLCMGSGELAAQWADYNAQWAAGAPCQMELHWFTEPAQASAAAASAGVSVDMQEEEYFIAYENMAVHEVMLRDKPRTETYRAAISAAVARRRQGGTREVVVLDVGAGTGVLSLFAAAAGATRVYAVEASGLHMLTKALVAANGFGETGHPRAHRAASMLPHASCGRNRRERAAREDGRRGAPRAGRHHRLGVDGLLPPARAWAANMYRGRG